MHESHPIAQEELMAYLDGELSPDRAATAAGHLEHCRECQGVAADLQGVSRRLMTWDVESPSTPITEAMAAALSEPRKKLTRRTSSRSKWAIGLVAASAVILVAFILIPPLMMSQKQVAQPRFSGIMGAPARPASANLVKTKNPFAAESLATSPMIAHTAQLS